MDEKILNQLLYLYQKRFMKTILLILCINITVIICYPVSVTSDNEKHTRNHQLPEKQKQKNDSATDVASSPKQPDESLIKACQKADYSLILQAIKEGADLNTRDKNQNTPLLLIARKKCSDSDTECMEQTVLMSEILIENGAFIDFSNSNNHTALYAAIKQRNQPLVKYLLKKGASLEKAKTVRPVLVDYRRFGGGFKPVCEMIKLLATFGMEFDTATGTIKLDTPLIKAVKHGKDADMVRCLLDAGADPFAVNDYNQTALMWISSFNDPELVHRILSYSDSEKVNIKSENGDTALHFAARQGRFYNVELLLDAGSDINAKNYYDERTALHLTTQNRYEFAEKDYYETARLLIQRGADINVTDKSGNTPLILACDKGNTDFISLFIKKGAELNVKNKAGISAIFKLSRLGETEAINIFCSENADLDLVDNAKKTPLMEAISYYHIDTALKLIACGADIHYKDSHGTTALIEAVKRGSKLKKVINKLIEIGVDVNAQSRNNITPLMVAPDADIALMLIENGANIHLEDSNGRTAMSYAAKRDETFRPVVRSLIELQADINIQDNRMMTPLMVVKDIGIAKILMEAGADLHLRNKAGRTAYDCAVLRRQSEIAKLLETD